MRSPRATANRERGASIVELALIAPVMVLLVMGVLDLARAYRMHIQLENAAREGAAFAQLHPNDFDCGPAGNVTARVATEELATTPALDIDLYGQDGVGGGFVAISGCGGSVAQPGERVRVDVTAEFAVLTPMVADIVGDTMRLTGSAEMRVQGRP